MFSDDILQMYLISGQFSVSQEGEKTWLQCECDRWRLKYNLEGNEE